MEPFSTLAQISAPWAPGWGGGGRAGSRPSRRGLEAGLSRQRNLKEGMGERETERGRYIGHMER
jgi:hypothetical protein